VRYAIGANSKTEAPFASPTDGDGVER
jgi:hypothetical protein